MFTRQCGGGCIRGGCFGNAESASVMQRRESLQLHLLHFHRKIDGHLFLGSFKKAWKSLDREVNGTLKLQTNLQINAFA